MIPFATLQNPGSALTADNFTQHDLLPRGCSVTEHHSSCSVMSRCALSCRKSVESGYRGLKMKMKGYPETPQLLRTVCHLIEGGMDNQQRTSCSEMRTYDQKAPTCRNSVNSFKKC